MTAAPKQSRWIRVSKSQPCPICGRADYCGFTPDGTAVRCMRTPNDHPSISRDGETGWMHKLDGDRAVQVRGRIDGRAAEPATVRHDLPDLMRNYHTAINPPRLDRFAAAMGLDVANLRRLGIGWAHDKGAWAFPMYDGAARLVGIRLRTPEGGKYTIRGSHNGLFIPDQLPMTGTLYIAEGPTSSCALLDLGLAAIGRPSCSGGTAYIRALLAACGRRDVVIVGDHDERKTRPDGSSFYPGQEGADALAQQIVRLCRSVKVIVPPFCKDARDWKRAGATAAVIGSVARAANYVREVRRGA
jgi:hypothetical protein